jgi:hypothetical protein
MSIQTLTPWSLHRFGTTCSPLSLEDPKAWKLHIACSNSGLQAHRLCTKSSFSSFHSVLAIWLCHNIIILSASNFSASTKNWYAQNPTWCALLYTPMLQGDWRWMILNIHKYTWLKKPIKHTSCTNLYRQVYYIQISCQSTTSCNLMTTINSISTRILLKVSNSKCPLLLLKNCHFYCTKSRRSRL